MMKRNGNANTNRTYNPQNTKPPIPLDVDEVDGVLERFIRQKYDQQSFLSGRTQPTRRQDTGSTRSSEDQPPPLPPKPAKRFGFGLRSSSSALPLHRNAPLSPPRSPPNRNGWQDEPLRINKQSRVFGASVGGSNENMDLKLVQLRDMGFSDDKRNASVLKGLGGNLERTIESLVRLGEGSNPVSRARTPNQSRNVAVSQPLPATTEDIPESTNGLSFTSSSGISRADTGSGAQHNAQPSTVMQRQAPPRALSPSNPALSQSPSYNPFDPANDQRLRMASMDQSFSNMQVSQQPLFPNATGGYPNQPTAVQDARLQTMTPPVPQLPNQYIQSNPYIQQNPPSNNNYNPFYQPTQQSAPVSPNPYLAQQQQFQTSPYNPFLQNTTFPSQAQYAAQSPQTYSPQAQQGSFQQQAAPRQYAPQQPQQQQMFATQQSVPNPAQYAMQSQQQAQLGFNPYQPTPLLPQQTGRIDKSSILALYNYPHLAPAPQTNENINQLQADGHEMPNVNGAPGHPPQRSVTMPIQASTGSKNPFQSSLSPQPPSNLNPQPMPPGIGRHVSQESVDIGGFESGRHSPDAFASLSARYVR